VTAGIVSALGDAIQTDAAISSGSSGGPLIAATGRVIGVATARPRGTGFAVPINSVRDVTSQLIERGRVDHASLGLEAQPLDGDMSRLFNLPVDRGLIVVSVNEESGAGQAGIRAGTDEVVVGGMSYQLGGDIIVEVDGKPVQTAEALREAVSAKKPGGKVSIDLYRGDEKQSFEVTLGRRTASPQR
jgi:S1-C subfamily serine protease